MAKTNKTIPACKALSLAGDASVSKVEKQDCNACYPGSLELKEAGLAGSLDACSCL